MVEKEIEEMKVSNPKDWRISAQYNAYNSYIYNHTNGTHCEMIVKHEYVDFGLKQIKRSRHSLLIKNHGFRLTSNRFSFGRVERVNNEGIEIVWTME